MIMDKQKMVYVGVALFAFLVIVNSTKKVVLEEVTSENTTKTFDNTSLPYQLRPPYRMADGEQMPKTIAKRTNQFSSFLGLKPRFDT
jgi:hypothetical protein